MPARRHRAAPDRVAVRVGKRVRKLRADAGVSFSDLVARTGLGRGYISELERGLVVPTVGTLARIASALNVTIADLVIGDDDRGTIFDLMRRHPELLDELRAVVAKKMPRR